MALEVMVPQGQFGYQPQAEREGHYLAIAAGSGITPMLAIISATLATEPNSHFTLIYGNRSSQSMMFRQALADLKDKYPQRLQLVSIFSQERLDSDLLFGRIDGEKLQALAKTLINFRQYDEAFICGPSAMMDDAEATLKALGMPDKSIHLERFNTSGLVVRPRSSGDRNATRVAILLDGRRLDIDPDGGRRKHSRCRPASGGGSAVCLQRRRLRHLQMQSAEGREGGHGRPTTAWSRTSWRPGMC